MDTAKSIREYIMKAAPSEWLEYADELRKSSEEIFSLNNTSLVASYHPLKNVHSTRPGVSRTYMLLIGISLENSLKGLLISEDPNYLKDGKIDPLISAGHNLYDLGLKSTTFSFLTKEFELLQILSDAIPYWGKYPIPKKFQQIKIETNSSVEIRETYLELFHKLERHIYDMTKFGWKGPNDVVLNEWFASHLEDLPDGHEKMTFEELFKLRREKQKCG